MTTRTLPPTRTSTSTSVVSQSCAACHQRRITSSLVHASNTACTGAWKVRVIRSVFSLKCEAVAGVGRAALSRRARRPVRRPRPPLPGRAPPRAPVRRERSRGLRVSVVVVPPTVRRCLRMALRRVLPLLLAPESGDVEVAPRAPYRLVAAAVDEVGAEDLVAVADEGVGAVPLVHPEVLVEVVGDRVPGDRFPPVALLQALDLRLGSARGEGERRVPGVQMGGMRDLVGHERASHAGPPR